MDISSLGIASVAAITVICYLIGLIAKASNLDNKWIPVVCGISGAVLGIIGMIVMPDYPATDYLTACAVGAVSGFASTGINQIFKQLGKEDA